MKKVLFLTLLILGVSFATKASGPMSSTISLGPRVGIGAIMPAGNMMVDYTPGFAWGLDLQYTYMFNQFFGITAGIAYNSLSSSISGSDIISTYTGDMLVTDVETGYEMLTDVRCVGNTTSVKEHFDAAFIEIPLLLAIHNNVWYYNIGLKFAVPLKMNAHYEYGTTLMNVDSICRTGTKLLDPMPQPSAPGDKGDYDAFKTPLPLYVLLAMEIGYTFEFSHSSSVTLGAYLDYGLNDASLSNDPNAELLKLDGRKIEYYRGAVKSNMMSAVRYYRLGFHVAYNFGFGGASKGANARPYSRSKRLL